MAVLALYDEPSLWLVQLLHVADETAKNVDDDLLIDNANQINMSVFGFLSLCDDATVTDNIHFTHAMIVRWQPIKDEKSRWKRTTPFFKDIGKLPSGRAHHRPMRVQADLQS